MEKVERFSTRLRVPGFRDCFAFTDFRIFAFHFEKLAQSSMCSELTWITKPTENDNFS